VATNIEVYDYEGQIERLLARVKSSSLVEENKQALLGFYRYLIANGLSTARTCKYLLEAFRLSQLGAKPFVDFDKAADMSTPFRKISTRIPRRDRGLCREL